MMVRSDPIGSNLDQTAFFYGERAAILQNTVPYGVVPLLVPYGQCKSYMYRTVKNRLVAKVKRKPDIKLSDLIVRATTNLPSCGFKLLGIMYLQLTSKVTHSKEDERHSSSMAIGTVLHKNMSRAM